MPANTKSHYREANVVGNLKHLVCLMAIPLAIVSYPSEAGAPEMRYFSEEQGVSNCPQGKFITGIWCSGSYCDNKKLECRSYTNHFDPDAQHRWSRWFSEERPNRETTHNGFASGLGCSGKYCDNIRIRFTTTPRKRNTGDCYWTNLYSEEQRIGRCNQGFEAGCKRIERNFRRISAR